MPSLAQLQRYLWVRVTSRKLAETSLVHARRLLASQDPDSIQTALQLLDLTLKAFPRCEKAIELKARALLCLRRYKDIISLLQESVPSLKAQPALDKVSLEEKIRLLPSQSSRHRTRKVLLSQCFLIPLRRRKLVRCSTKGDKDQWKSIVLGQACCHLGMMEDALILLSNGKREASAAHRKQSSGFEEDTFFPEGSHTASDVDVVRHLLGNIRLLLRRRTAALAALDAGLYTEAARHFSKILDGRRGTPQGFVAECYMHRAVAHQAANKVVDALADCNRCLALNPMCAEALSTRVTLYEMIGCLSDAVEDLGRLKALYETIFTSNGQLLQMPHSSTSELQGCIDFINSKIASVVERIKRQSTVDYYRVLGLSRSCSRAEVERAYLILSLKHRPDKSAHFVDRCEFVDERDIEIVKGEARTHGLKLFKLLQKAYTWIMSMTLEEEMKRARHKNEGNGATAELLKEGHSSWSWGWMSQAEHGVQGRCSSGVDGEAAHEVHNQCVSRIVQEAGHQAENQHPSGIMIEAGHRVRKQDFLCVNGEAEDSLDGGGCAACQVQSQSFLCVNRKAQDSLSDGRDTMPDDDWLDYKESHEAEDTAAISFDYRYLEIQEANEFSDVDATLFAQTATCREVASVGALHSQGLPSEAWLGPNEWGHSAVHPLSVT